jgi:sugar phosphate isomerase/epimerase
MTRRQLLSLLGATALASGEEHKVTIAAHPWVYAATRPKNDINEILDQIFADMKWAGIEAIELRHPVLIPDGMVERVRELTRRHELPVIGMSYSAPMWNRARHEAILKEARVLIDRLQQVGGRTLGTTVGDARERKTPEQLDAQAELVSKLMGICNDHGVVLNLHNHTFEVADNEYDLKGTLARVSGVKLGPDFGWLQKAGIDPVDFIRRYGDRIVYGHLKDVKADSKFSEALGEGAMDYAAIGRALRAVGFHGDLAIELTFEPAFQPTRPIRDSLKMSRQYVRRTMGY